MSEAKDKLYGAHVLLPTIDSNEAMFQRMGIARLNVKPEKRITIAVIDMGFRLSHKKLRNYIHINKGEIAGNLTDDDGNGYADDVMGWDAADDDPDVAVPKGKEDPYYHGTYISSIILSVLENTWGEEAAEYVRIIPIKIVSDDQPRLQLEDAMKGLAYAKAVKPDIICCAWSGGRMNEQESAIMRSFISSGTLIVAAVGNYMTETVPNPASFPGVLAVASTDNAGKIANLSNYGMRVDLSAPGSKVYGAHPIADNAFLRESGSSPSTAFVTGMACVLKILSPAASPFDIREALINTAQPIGHLNPSYAGKLGAGIPDMKAAVAYLMNPSQQYMFHDPKRTKGRIHMSGNQQSFQWNIHPDGGFEGLKLQATNPDDRGTLKVMADDSVYLEGPASNLLNGTTIPGRRFQVKYLPGKKNNTKNAFIYQIVPIDSARLYCSGNVIINVKDSGVIEDGSGTSDYANRCDCQWQLIAPPGKRIRIDSIETDTELNADILAFYDGEYTMEEAQLSRHSGLSNHPPVISRTNQLLVWFYSNQTVTGKGWSIRYHVIDP
jgi:Subtilase family/CUB domain